MGQYRCRECKQPIRREQAVRTAAGGYTEGHCSRHFAQMHTEARMTVESNEQELNQIAEELNEQEPTEQTAAGELGEATEQVAEPTEAEQAAGEPAAAVEAISEPTDDSL